MHILFAIIILAFMLVYVPRVVGVMMLIAAAMFGLLYFATVQVTPHDTQTTGAHMCVGSLRMEC